MRHYNNYPNANRTEGSFEEFENKQKSDVSKGSNMLEMNGGLQESFNCNDIMLCADYETYNAEAR